MELFGDIEGTRKRQLQEKCEQTRPTAAGPVAHAEVARAAHRQDVPRFDAARRRTLR